MIEHNTASVVTHFNHNQTSLSDIIPETKEALSETSLPWRIMAQCPRCLTAVKEGLRNQPLLLEKNQNEYTQSRI